MVRVLVPLLVSVVYLLFLSRVSSWTERSKRLSLYTQHPVSFGLILGVYATSWSFYGSVGFASSYGYVFLAINFGVTLSCLAIPILWEPLADVVRRHRLTSVADLFAYRYQSSLAGALVTIFMLASMLPYLAMQIRSISATATFLAAGQSNPWLEITYALLLVVFAAGVGVRYVNPREQRPGLLATLAVESLFKLLALLLAGGVALWAQFGGVQGLNNYLNANPKLLQQIYAPLQTGPWTALLLASFFAAFLLPRQFHVAFVERPNWRVLRHASWSFPLFLFLLNLPLPILYWAGAARSAPGTPPDFFVLTANSNPTIRLLTFLGGVSASSAMVLMATIALCGMVTNHLVVPVIRKRVLPFASVLEVRRLVIAGLVTAGFVLHLLLPKGDTLVDLGLVSFVAILQLVPGVLGLLFWPRATRYGLMWGMFCGIGAWALLAALPLLNLTGASTLPDWFGLQGADPRSSAIWISLSGNVVGFVLGSLFSTTRTSEQIAAATCSPTGAAVTHIPPESVQALEDRLSRSLGAEDAASEIKIALEEHDLTHEEKRPLALGLLAETVERNLSEWLGPMAARRAVAQHGTHSPLAASLRFVQNANLTAQGPQERSLREVQQYLFDVLYRLPLGVCAVTPEQTVVVWNKALVSISNIPEERTVSGQLEHLPEPWSSLLQEALSLQGNDVLERKFSNHDMVVQHVRLQQALIAEEGAVILIEDLTERQRLEVQLAHQARLASVGRLAAGVAHEIGNPLTGIVMLAKNMQHDIDDESMTERLGLIVHESDRIEEIIRTLLLFSRKVPLGDDTHKDVDVAELVEQAIRLVSIGRRRQYIQWHKNVEAGLSVWGHSQRLIQVLVNLLANASDVTEENGSIHVRAFRQGDGTVCIEVEDEGPGIPLAWQERVFEPFFTTKEVGQGTGLGLAISYSLVEQHKGQLSWRAAPTQGTVFQVELPSQEPKQEGSSDSLDSAQEGEAS